MPLPSPRSTACAILGLALFASGSGLHAEDAAPIDVNQLLKGLKGLQDQNATQVKTIRVAALQKITPAASSAAGAVALWEQSVRAVQMDGAGKEASTFKAWRDSEGELFKEREVQEAVSLSMSWLALTLQRANGATIKELLPAVMNYAKALFDHQALMEKMDEKIKADSDAVRAETGPRREIQEKALRSEVGVKRTHDSVLNQDVSNNVVSQAFKLTGLLSSPNWEMNAGSFDGIYKNVILPELRTQGDQRVFEYWDTKLRIEADRASKSKLTYEVEKFNNLRRPKLLWGRAEEYANIGQKNRAATELFNIIKTYPTHPDSADWVAELQKMFAPADAPTTPAAPGAPASAGAAPAP